MKFILCLWYLPSLLTAVIAAQSMENNLPECAIGCIDVPFSPCNTSDQACICTSTAYQTDFMACVSQSCAVREVLTTRNVTANACGWPQRDRSHLLRDVPIPLVTFATIAVAARLASRMPRYRGPFGADDYVIVVTWMLSVAYAAVLWLMSKYGFGRDVWTVPFNHISLTMMHFMILEYLYVLTCWFTKISILLLYLRLFPDEGFRRIVKIGLVLCALTCFCFFWSCLFQCYPVSYSWTWWDGEHKGGCSNIKAQGWAYVSLNISADLAILVLPIPTIWKLTLAVEKKLGVIAMFSVGAFVVAVSIVRTTWLPLLATSTNITWDSLDAGMWSAVEIEVAVICACMPGIRAFLTNVFPGNRWKRLGSAHEQAKASHRSTASNATIGSGGRAMKQTGRYNEVNLGVTDRELLDMEAGSIARLDRERVCLA